MPSEVVYQSEGNFQTPLVREGDIESDFIEKLRDLKYSIRPDIRNRAALEQNFREKFEALNRVKLTEGEFQRLLEEIITPDVFTAARKLREITSFARDDGTPLNYTLVNIRDWCKNDFEVVSQLRVNTDNSHHRYDVILLINGVPVVQAELKTLGIHPRRAMEQIVEYKNDPGNGYTRTLFASSNADSRRGSASCAITMPVQHHLELRHEQSKARSTPSQPPARYALFMRMETTATERASAYGATTSAAGDNASNWHLGMNHTSRKSTTNATLGHAMPESMPGC